MRCAIVSANFGSYDPIRPIAKQILANVDDTVNYFMFSDKVLDVTNTLWNNIIVQYPRTDLHPRMRAKYIKLQHHRIPELKSYDAIIWVDAAVEITSAKYAQVMLDNSVSGLNCFRHPERDCVYTEAHIILKYFQHKIVGERILDQMKAYSDEELYPQHNGLYAMTHFCHMPNDISKRLFDEWWLENIKWSFRDQLSLPIVYKRLNIKPNIIKWEHPYDSKYLIWYSHP